MSRLVARRAWPSEQMLRFARAARDRYEAETKKQAEHDSAAHYMRVSFTLGVKQ
jgi:hypothetical protein